MATAKNTEVKNAAAVQMPTARTPEQQAALDKLRAEKAQAAQAAVNKVEDKVFVGNDERIQRAVSFLADILYPVPREGEHGEVSWKRKLAAFFATIVLAGGAGYVIGQLAGYAMVGCFALTGSAFLMWTIFVIAIILACYAGAKIGQHVGNYILSGQIDRDFVAAKNKVTGWFTKKDKVVAAPAAA